MNKIQQTKKISSLYLSLLGLVLLIVGVLFLFFGNRDSILQSYPSIKALLRDFGSLTIVSVTLSFIWQFIGKRVFFNEVLAKLNLSKEIEYSGLKKITFEPNDFDWNFLLNSSKHLDIFFAYGTTWRGQNELLLGELLSKNSIQIRVILPNPEDNDLMKVVANEWNQNTKDLVKRISSAKKYFENLFENHKSETVEHEIWYTSHPPFFSLFLFDNNAMFSMYGYGGRQGVPHFLISNLGELYRYFSNQIRNLTNPEDSKNLRIY